MAGTAWAHTCPPAIGPWRSRGSARGGTASRRVRRCWPCACPRYDGSGATGSGGSSLAPAQRLTPCFAGAGLAVRHVRVARRCGAGPIPVGAQAEPARQARAGGIARSPLSRPAGQAPPAGSTNTLWFQIGAGVSLPGVVAARCGAQVILSDSEELPQCLQSCRRSCLMNRLPHVPVLGLTWGRVSPELLALAPIDIILGSDVFFDPKGTLMLLGIFGL